ncbi:MAG: hypothetical protein LBJ92_01835 [Holosporales bacterium]|jgi:hypothetical protein|nr:hypothetical protein [Holosporales bacterium]
MGNVVKDVAVMMMVGGVAQASAPEPCFPDVCTSTHIDGVSVLISGPVFMNVLRWFGKTPDEVGSLLRRCGSYPDKVELITNLGMTYGYAQMEYYLPVLRYYRHHGEIDRSNEIGEFLRCIINFTEECQRIRASAFGHQQPIACNDPRYRRLAARTIG